MGRFLIRDIAVAGLVAAMYAVLSLAFAPISFGVYQVRVAEALSVLPFLTGAAVPGLYAGCLLANIFGNMGWPDIVFGPFVTLAAALITYGLRRLGRRAALVLAGLPVVLLWVGAVYLLSGFHLAVATVSGALLAAAAILPLVPRKGGRAGQQEYREWLGTRLVIALIMALVAAIFLTATKDAYFIVAGGLLVIAAVAGAAVLAWSLVSDVGPAILLAPLPPVVLNAFGVAAYLAPLLGVNYWFAAQMIGVGQLIACYVIGLPLLLLLRRRMVFAVPPRET
ncbi:MAG TPA: QueT transporter family protein [candidate division Zixibacteria bacterium]|nr:QueT transporter family protein [candidate division Zixibacteria bacterium]MDD4918765.1 QueT transporter family protein [candidate division Zixibacteria bacterium]MDM7974294.1 QueT transporter family protein [candidate division Zixibacteria bacterium]HOD66264.1 QueT transporter family protein [candidate division Zixibacteria bacterium]HPM37034.1 QueT transporter family protein [candidate division Zixibacteria bacterium]